MINLSSVFLLRRAVLAMCVLSLAVTSTLSSTNPCVAPDNGAGTVDLPALCPIVSLDNSVMRIVTGLPPGSSIECRPQLSNFTGISRTPGGSLGGEVLQFSAQLLLMMQGTGALTGYLRTVQIPMVLQVHTAPRTPGLPFQTFDTDMFMMQGQLPPGDPDFDLLRITAGAGLGLPSPGHTTLTRLPGGTWNVDSFFDITYQIDFVGHAGGPLSGMSGSTVDEIRLHQGLDIDQCKSADNGTGTINLPAPCPMEHPAEPLKIVSGLPPGASLELTGQIRNYTSVVRTPGGSLGGEVVQFSATMPLEILGLGLSSSYHRSLSIPLSTLEVHTAPRTPGEPVQSFPTDMFRLQGQLPPGDPDFDLLRITAGTDFGLPSPGHTTLRQLPGGDWHVDSFFDITYRIDFIGAPGGPMAGMSGSTQGRATFQQGSALPSTLCPTPDFLTTEQCPYFAYGFVRVPVPGLTGHASFSPLIRDFSISSVTPGGDLGGDVVQGTCALFVVVEGDALAPYRRLAVMDASFVMHTGPRGTGKDVERFRTKLVSLEGQLPPGDPDFDLLRVTGGSGFGLPSPGHTTLTKLPGGDWAVDSFFDITYRIEFAGAPGGPIAGTSGDGTQRVHMKVGQETCDQGGLDDSVAPTATVGEAYSHQLHGSDPSSLHFFGPGSEPFIGGLVLHPNGLINGVATTPGCHLIDIELVNESGCRSLVPLSLQVAPAPAVLQLSSSDYPPPVDHVSTQCATSYGVIDVELQMLRLESLHPTIPLPAPGTSVLHDVTGLFRCEVSTNGGSTFEQIQGTCDLSQMLDRSPTGDVIDIELVSLSLVSSAPISVRVRESPSRPSIGRMTLESDGGTGYMISSFFDIWTELSLDGGASWDPADKPIRVSGTVTISPPSSARTFVIPHVLEKSGRTTNTAFTFDTQIFATYAGGLHGIPDGGGASVDLFLFDNTGQPMQGSTGDVCNPCTFTLDASTRKREIVVDDLIVSNGGGFDTPVKEGYGIVVVHGDSASVNVQGFVVNSHTGASDVSVFGFDPEPIRAPAGLSRTFVVPHVLESNGSVLTTPSAFDTELYAVYAGGQSGIPGGSSATLDLYLFDDSGSPMQGSGGVVCNPCTYNMGPAERKKSIRIDDLISNAGGFGSSAVKLGFGVIVVGGSDPDGVNLQGFVVNSHTGPFDLSVFGFEPQPIAAAAYAGAVNLNPKTFVLPHVLEKSGSIASTQNTFDTQVFATYSAGLAGLPSGGGASVDVYLFDEVTGQLMKGSNGQDVCAPCTYSLSEANRKQTIRIDDLITTNGGGFDTPVKLGFGIIVVGGDEDHVALQGFVVNSHSGPLDVSMWGGPPQVVDEAPPVVAARTFVIPHVLERSGSITNTPFTFDTQIFATYTGGLGGSVGGGSGATLNLYLFDQATGLPMTTATGEVCNPCSVPLSESLRKQSIRIDDLIVAAGGFPSPEQKGYATLVVGGDANKVHLSSEIVNSHTGPFDLSVFGFDPVPITTASLTIPVVNVNPVAVDFGSVVVGNTEQSLITIRNGGGGLLVLTAPELTPDSDPSFSIVVPPAETELGAGQVTTMTIGFSPGLPTTDLSGRLMVGSDGGTITIPLHGDGVLVDPDLFLTITPDTMIAKDPLNGKLFKPVKRAKPGKPIIPPNWANLLDETVAQGGFQPDESESDGAGGMRVGISFMDEISTDKWKPNKDSAKVRAWVRLTKWDFKKDAGKGFNALQKTLENKTFNHYVSDPTATPRGLDSTGYPGSLSRKFLKKQLTKLDPKKTPNRLFAELVALKFNIAASQLGKTPVGFGELELDIDTSMFHDMSVMEISKRADSMMTYWQAYADSEYHEMFAIISALNRAFLGALDTASFMATSTGFPLGKLVLKGQVDIDDVPFLKKPDPFVPTVIAATTHEVESGEDEEFDDEESFEGLAVAAKLYQNYPNPFNPSTTIAFRLREESRVSLKIHNLLGQEVATLLNNEEMEEGLQVLQFNASQLSSGVYFYRIHAQGLEESALRTIETGKMILLK